MKAVHGPQKLKGVTASQWIGVTNLNLNTLKINGLEIITVWCCIWYSFVKLVNMSIINLEIIIGNMYYKECAHVLRICHLRF